MERSPFPRPPPPRRVGDAGSVYHRVASHYLRIIIPIPFYHGHDVAAESVFPSHPFARPRTRTGIALWSDVNATLKTLTQLKRVFFELISTFA